MSFFLLKPAIKTIFSWQRLIVRSVLLLACLFFLSTPPALAGINDDKFDGNIFVLYGSNASLVTTKAALAQSLARKRPTLLVFYVDDSSDCKQYTAVISRLQAYYGRAADFIAVSVDSIPNKSTYAPTEPGYYYTGAVPQTVVFNQSSKVVLNQTGQVPYEQIDDTLREVFDLLPRSESVELKRRPVNEFSTELAQ